MKEVMMKKMLVLFLILLFLFINVAQSETLTVPYNGTTVYSSVLIASQLYEIRAEGVVYNESNSSWKMLDAEWLRNCGHDEPWYELSGCPGGFLEGAELLINGSYYDWLGTSDAIHFHPHTFSPSHEYILYLWGEDASISLLIYDSYYGDNSGVLTVNITAITNPSFVLLTPNGGELLTSETIHSIEWTPVIDPNVVIEYSIDNGQTWTPIVTTENDGVYDWEVPSSINSDQCLVRATEQTNPIYTDTSDEVFTISACLNRPSADINGDCVVNLIDLAELASQWLNCGFVPIDLCP